MIALDFDDPLNEQQKKSKVLNLGIAFCVLFTAYNVSQSFLTTLYGDIGYICLSFIYLFMTLGSFLTPYVYDNLGIKQSFVFSSMTYALFVACTGLKSNVAMILSSICLGLGGSLLWLTQGNYLTLVADGSSFGTLNGLFHSVHSINNIIGTITTGILLQMNFLSVDSLPLILTGLAIAGVLLFTRVSNVEQNNPQTILSISERIKNMLFIAKQEKMMLLFGSMIYQGMSLSLMNGVAPTLVGTKYIPFLFLVYGVCRMTGSYFWGKIYDNYSWKILWIGNFFFAASAFGGIYMAYQLQSSSENSTSYFWIMMYFGAAMGAAESCVTSLINSTLMEFFSATSNSAFAVYRFVTSLATSLAFFFTPKCSLETLELVSFSMLVIATISFYYLRNTK